jgi:signal transduction histidine kinase
VPVQDETGEMSWPLVERRRTARSADPEGRFEQLSRANELLLALQKMAVTLSSSLDVDEVIERGVDNARRVVKADAIIVCLLDPTNGAWTVVSGPDIVVASAGLPPEASALSCVTIERPVEASSGLLWPRATHGVYQCLRARGEVLGFIAGEWTDDRRPSVVEREALVGVADALALALDNARIFGLLADRVATDERSRVARDLHDRVAGSLAAIGFELDEVARSLGENERKMITRVREHVTETIVDIRSLLDDLRDDRHGRHIDRPSLDDLADRVSRRSSISVKVDDHDVRPDVMHKLAADGTATELHLILREALLNAERHSGAESVRISVVERDGMLTLEVRDDGRGFDPTHLGHGLSGMRERAEWIGATLDVDTGSTGTRVRVRLVVDEDPR